MRRKRGRVLLGDDRSRGGHAAVDQVVVCWNLDFFWTPLYILTLLTIRTLSFDLRKFRLAPDHPKRNYCVSWGVSVRRLGTVGECFVVAL